MESNQIRAAGYVRVSTPGQVTEGESLTTQRHAIANYAQREGFTLTGTYADEGKSGKNLDARAGITHLLEDAGSGAFSVVIIQRLSRLGRNARDLLNISAQLQKAGIALVSIKEKIDMTHPFGRAMFTMLSAIAELEREVIEEQMRENMMALWRRREIYIGAAPYGYRWNKKHKKMAIVRKEAKIIKQIYQMYLDEHLGLDPISRILWQRGVRTKRGYLDSSRIGRILKNPIFKGTHTVNQFYQKVKGQPRRPKPVSEHPRTAIGFHTPG